MELRVDPGLGSLEDFGQFDAVPDDNVQLDPLSSIER
jgi:hypothetical protein